MTSSPPPKAHPRAPHLDKAATIAYLFCSTDPKLPTLRRFANSKVSIYADDHNPPHFHIEGRGFRAIVEIETLVVRAGNVRTASDALAWARSNKALLRSEWRRLNRPPRAD